MVEHVDTEALATVGGSDSLLDLAANNDPSVARSTRPDPHVVPRWRLCESQKNLQSFLAHEYSSEEDPSQFQTGLGDAVLLDDHILTRELTRQDGTSAAYSLTADETREAYRSLKGMLLRQEVYGLDGNPAADRPYAVSESNYTIKFVAASRRQQARHLLHPRARAIGTPL